MSTPEEMNLSMHSREEILDLLTRLEHNDQCCPGCRQLVEELVAQITRLAEVAEYIRGMGPGALIGGLFKRKRGKDGVPRTGDAPEDDGGGGLGHADG